ncbi:hypothetical protein SLEP1_g60109 [Rubroshorea leprosula]|uniref:Uncharacterized protein n=1 Tax=Rubroshorea leprosula TaxID=152421 RepID=A0AAV5MUT5_9ROSI|nr:hypothetical protein SLEP1_g60109 [Rubroshorea leprosula]
MRKMMKQHFEVPKSLFYLLRKCNLVAKTSKICLRQQNPKKESCDKGGAEVI